MIRNAPLPGPQVIHIHQIQRSLNHPIHNPNPLLDLLSERQRAVQPARVVQKHATAQLIRIRVKLSQVEISAELVLEQRNLLIIVLNQEIEDVGDGLPASGHQRPEVEGADFEVFGVDDQLQPDVVDDCDVGHDHVHVFVFELDGVQHQEDFFWLRADFLGLGVRFEAHGEVFHDEVFEGEDCDEVLIGIVFLMEIVSWAINLSF